MNVPSMAYTTVTAGSTPPVPLRLTAANAKQSARPVVARTSAAPPTRDSNSKKVSDMIRHPTREVIYRSRSHSGQEVARRVRSPTSVQAQNHLLRRVPLGGDPDLNQIGWRSRPYVRLALYLARFRASAQIMSNC